MYVENFLFALGRVRGHRNGQLAETEVLLLYFSPSVTIALESSYRSKKVKMNIQQQQKNSNNNDSFPEATN